jgi:hypothetical protein
MGRENLDLFDPLHPRVGCKGLCQTRGYPFLQQTQSAWHPGQVLHLAEEIRPRLARRSFALDLGKCQGVSIQILQPGPRDVTDGHETDKEKGDRDRQGS